MGRHRRETDAQRRRGDAKRRGSGFAFYDAEKCDAMTGDAKAACMTQAKTTAGKS